MSDFARLLLSAIFRQSIACLFGCLGVVGIKSCSCDEKFDVANSQLERVVADYNRSRFFAELNSLYAVNRLRCIYNSLQTIGSLGR